MTPNNATFWDWVASEPGKAALAGAAGGMVRWLTLRGKLWPDGIINLLVGCLCAIYIGPLAEPLLEPIIGRVSGNDGPSGLGSFLIGMGGLTISGLIVDAWSLRRKSVSGGGDETAD